MGKEHEKFKGVFVELNSNLILVKLNGDLRCDACIEEFKNFSDELDKEIEKNYKKTKTKVNLLLDVNNLTTYNIEAFKYLEESASRTKDYDNKTAVIGASYSLELLAESISALTGHSDIKFFKTKKEAIDWLQE
ncbi:MAG: STAS/SEC14 domain-containing protein [Candidatus Spechtbacterales bacterium]|nr:STAS/SEC14 domain-containing protein [Candidatus Spechtbacterales bacterium]